MNGKVDSIAPSDAEALVELFDGAGPFVAARGMSDYWLYARLFGSTCLCVRDDDGSPIAVLISFRDQSPGSNEIYVQDVAVHPAHRRGGYGKVLLEELHRRAEEWGVSRVWLTSEPENTAARALWARYGYENLPADYEESGVWITCDLKGPGKDRAVFERRVPAPSNGV